MLRPVRPSSAARLVFAATRTRPGNTPFGSLSAILKRPPHSSNDERCSDWWINTAVRFHQIDLERCRICRRQERSRQAPVAVPGCPSGQCFAGYGNLEVAFLKCLAKAAEPFMINAYGFTAFLQLKQFAIHGIQKLALVL